MAKLKDLFLSDLSTFINPDEFGEIHNIDGNNVSVIVDNDKLQERRKKEFDGISVGELLYFAKVSDLTKKPMQDSIQLFDKRPYLVFNVREDNGIYEVILQQNRG
jgi:hypothetical protein